jgi:arsenate reductase
VQVLTEKNIDVTGQRSKDVTEYLGHVNFGYLITVCGHAEEKCPTAFLGLSQRMHWPFEDPAAFEGSDEEKLAKFREVRDQIAQRLQAWIAQEEQVSAS